MSDLLTRLEAKRDELAQAHGYALRTFLHIDLPSADFKAGADAFIPMIVELAEALAFYANDENWYLHKDASTGAEVRRSIEYFDTKTVGVLDDRGNNYIRVTAGERAKAAQAKLNAWLGGEHD